MRYGNVWKTGGRQAIVLALVCALAACGGGGSVQGTAEPVPGTDVPAPEPGTGPTPQPSDPVRFDSVAPDPHAAPTFQASPAVAYDLGNLAAMSGTPAFTFVTPVRGWMRFPLAALDLDDAGRRFPIVVFLHGNHTVADPSYQGYDYLARNLAEHGYVVVSIDANGINGLPFGPGGTPAVGEPSSLSRGQLILGTLDRLRQIDEAGGPGMTAMLRGRLDFTRIGLMGHSRGGQGLANALKLNLQRVSATRQDLKAQLAATPDLFADFPALRQSVSDDGTVDAALFEQALKTDNVFFGPASNTVEPYHFRAGMLLAPTDFYGNVGLANVPLAVVLPSCDGDVYSEQGARTYDNNRFGFDTDTAPRIQVLVRGTNHNYYNTEWREDDVYAPADPYCDPARAGTPRLSADDQRRGGLFLINGFMRRYVGGETAFDGYWSGRDQLPAAACPADAWPCDARVALTVQKDASQRLVVHRFAEADSLLRNTLGLGVALSGFDASAWCAMPYGSGNGVGGCLPDRLPGFEYKDVPGGLRSIAEHVQLAWSRPQASLVTALGQLSARDYDSLTFRVAVVRPFGQEVEATLVDAAGKRATVRASRYSDALYLGPRPPASGSPLVDDEVDAPFADGQATQLLNMVSLPLSAFEGIDLGALAELRLVLPRDGGKAAVTDIQFQRLGRR